MKTNLELEKIDKFYIVLSLVLIVMAVMVIFSFKSVFDALLTAYELDQKSLAQDVKVDNAKLDEAYSWAFNKTTIPLERVE